MRSIDERNALVEQYLPLVRPLAFVMKRRFPFAEIDDLVQDGCFGLIKACEVHDPTEYPNERQFRAFARTAIIQAMCNAHRGTKVVGSLNVPPEGAEGIEIIETLPALENTEAEVIDREQRISLRSMIACLPSTQRMVVRQCVLNDVPNKDLAKRLGRTWTWVGQTKHRAMKRLREVSQIVA